VFDGHGGWQVSDFVSDYLIMEINNQINNYHRQHHNDSGHHDQQQYQDHITADISLLAEMDLDDVLVKSFQNTEDVIIKNVKPAFELG